MDEGWTRFVFDTFNVPFQTLNEGALNEDNPRARFGMLRRLSQQDQWGGPGERGRRFRAVAVSDAAASVRGATLVINATPSGLDDSSMPVSTELLDASAVVLDLVVGRNETPLVRAARARGHRAADGLTMLIEQGALAFERWFGTPPDRDVMRRAVVR